MLCKVTKKKPEQIKATHILPQTPFWGKLKNEQDFDSIGFEVTVAEELLDPQAENKAVVKEDLLVLLRYVTENDCYAYVPYGPKLEPAYENHGLFLEKLSEQLKPQLPKECVFIRYDLMWENQWADSEFYDEAGEWMGPPPLKTQEFRVNFNTENWKLKKSTVDVLPKNTFFLNLQQKEDDLLYNMRYNTRYNIRAAKRKGVEVKTYNKEGLDQWYNLYCETAVRSGIDVMEKAFFENFMDLSKQEDDYIQTYLLSANYNNKPLASMFLVLTKKRATYLYGASTNSQKELRASYILQWEAIKKAKQMGCELYDMFGCAPNLDKGHPLHGVHLFKKGFGGELFHRMGCWDYPFSQQKYELIKCLEMQN